MRQRLLGLRLGASFLGRDAVIETSYLGLEVDFLDLACLVRGEVLHSHLVVARLVQVRLVVACDVRHARRDLGDHRLQRAGLIRW